MRGRRDGNVFSISCPHLHALFSLRKTLSPAAANQGDKAFILPLINSIHLANQVEELRAGLLTLESHAVSLECLLVQMRKVGGVKMLSWLLALCVFFNGNKCFVEITKHKE